MILPNLILRQLYTNKSLTREENGFAFELRNRLSDAVITEVVSMQIDNNEIPQQQLWVENGKGKIPISDVSENDPLILPFNNRIRIICKDIALGEGLHPLKISFKTKSYGQINISVEDEVKDREANAVKIPYDRIDDYTPQAVKRRQEFISRFSGRELEHITNYSFDPKVVRGNIENFSGVAQIPLGFAGPIVVNGEHAQGEFIIPLATTEGTLVASYNRGIKVLNLSGGVKTTIQGDDMQRAPVFVFEDARACNRFVRWINEHVPEIRREAEKTSHVVRLDYMDPYLSNRFVFLRFNFKTGDAAGQNMVGKATFSACQWIIENYMGIEHFYLESNFATDKKASHINILRTRGKRVTAEVILKKEVLRDHLRAEPEILDYHQRISTIGSLFSGANNNGAHSPNGIAAMFIAAGQDVANVAEATAALLHTELTPNHDLYVSITLPSLIVATYGGGTGLPTQRECLELMECYGKDKVNKFAEIVAAVVLAGEVSLGAAITSNDWVSSHERLGRNR